MLAKTPKRHRAEMVDGMCRLFRSDSKKEARRVFSELAAVLEGKADAGLDALEAAIDDVTAELVLPEPYRRRLRTTNMCERLHEEIRRRERVIRIFPNEASATRMLGALPERTARDVDERASLLQQGDVLELAYQARSQGTTRSRTISAATTDDYLTHP